MLAVVVALPIVLMVVACLLERFEAHAVADKPALRIRRPRPTATTEPAAPALALVRGTDGGAVGSAPSGADRDHAADTIRRAS